MKYEKIKNDLVQKIKQGKYLQGQRLPSIRQLASQYHCNKSTIIKAYQILEEEHLVYVKKQSGYYVADGLLKNKDVSEYYELNSGNPIISMTSLVDAKHCLATAVDQYSESSLNLSLQGVESLRNILPDFLSQFAIYAKKENIYLIQGITQIVSFLVETDFPSHHQKILVEEPTYSYVIDFLKTTKLEVITIKRDSTGINVKELERIFKENDIKCFYLTPRNHNPLGTTLDATTRKKIAALSSKYNVYIIEDDYFCHCSNTPKYLPITYYANGQNCIYLTSFTKLIPYIRIGICAIPSSFRDTFEEITQHSYFYSYQLPSLISQATCEAYLRSSLYHKERKEIMQLLKQNYRVLKEVTNKWNSDIVRVITSYSGYYFSLVINEKINLDILLEKLLVQKIKVYLNQRSYYHLENDNSIRLSMARIKPKELSVAMNIIYEVIMKMMEEIE